ncbi:MAG: hypothetical protein ACOC6F_02205 [bacterium]
MSYFVHTNHINAWSLSKGLASLGLDLHVVSESPGLLPVSECVPGPGDTLFFTDEAHLLSYYCQEEFEFFPRDVDAQLIDDKVRLADRLRAMGEEPVPHWPLSDPVQETLPEFPIYLKARHSWIGSTKLPRGYICKSKKDFEQHVGTIREHGLTLDWFFLQRLIAGDIGANYSTCGFFDHADAERSLLIVVRKLLGNERGKISTGAIVKTVQDPSNLTARTCRILEEIQYTGPFELEFLYDGQNEQYYVLELNPRFWMQHGFFIDGYDNCLLKRYVGLQETVLEARGLPFRPLVWVNGVHFFQLLIHGRLKRLRSFASVLEQNNSRETRVLWYPNRAIAAWHCIKRQLQKSSAGLTTVTPWARS